MIRESVRLLRMTMGVLIFAWAILQTRIFNKIEDKIKKSQDENSKDRLIYFLRFNTSHQTISSSLVLGLVIEKM